MAKFRSRLIKAGIAAAITAAAANSYAGLVLVGPQPTSGSGIGAVSTVLTIQSPGSTSTETGAVSFNGSDVTSGDAKTGASQTQTVTLGSTGATKPSDLRVIFNAVEPGGTANGINLDNLVLNIFSPTGGLLFTSGAFTPVTFNSTLNGTGNSGFAFKLDDASLAAAASVFTGSYQADRVGLTASASNATGGVETFYLQADASTVGPGAGGPGTGVGGGTGNAVPEPASLALLGVGLLALASRRSRKSA